MEKNYINALKKLQDCVRSSSACPQLEYFGIKVRKKVLWVQYKEADGVDILDTFDGKIIETMRGAFYEIDDLDQSSKDEYGKHEHKYFLDITEVSFNSKKNQINILGNLCGRGDESFILNDLQDVYDYVLSHVDLCNRYEECYYKYIDRIVENRMFLSKEEAMEDIWIYDESLHPTIVTMNACNSSLLCALKRFLRNFDFDSIDFI